MDARRAPRLLPRVGRLEPSYFEVDGPGSVALIVDGIRMRLHHDGSFELAEGIFPLARTTSVTPLPERLGGRILFSSCTPEDCWLSRAPSFVGAITPIGKLDVPVSAVVPGFEAIYVTIANTGLVVAVDPRDGRVTESTLLPPAPEYGAIVVVDDWFGAYLDPLRGLMTTRDAGAHWQPAFVRASGSLEDSSARVPEHEPIRTMVAEAGELLVDFGAQRRFLLTRRGDVRAANDHKSTAVSRSIRSWVNRWEMSELGGWPIELAVTRGAVSCGDIATVISRGRLAHIRLRDGRVLETHPVDVAPDRDCHALQAETATYFLCSSATVSSIYRLAAPQALERLGEFIGHREVVAVSSVGLLLRGNCAGQNQRQAGHYCSLRSGQTPQEVRFPAATGRERAVLLEDASVAILIPPRGERAGRVIRLGGSKSEISIDLPRDISLAQRRLLTQGFWLERPTVVNGAISSWVTLGDELVGVRVALTGELTLGEIVSGAARASFSESRVIVPDSSGYALESLDGGLTYLRPHLPIPVANGLGAIPKTTQQYGCSRVGCLLGDWLRIGWSEPRGVVRNGSLELMTAPEPLRLMQRKRRVPRLLCNVRVGSASAPATPARSSTSERTRAAMGREAVDGSLRSTAFVPFYGTAAPSLSAASLGFDRGWRDERVAMRGYARSPLRSGKLESWQLDLRVFQPLHRDAPWSVAASGIAFESVEPVARAFAHPRYGEHASSWSMVLDPDGDGALWSIDDHGRWRVFLLEPGQPIAEVTELEGRAPRRISDVARLKDGWYLLGTEPNPRLVAFSASSSRVVSEFDPRSRLLAGRLRMVKNRDETRIAYLVLSARLRAADLQWFVYPVNAKSGEIEAPIVVPLDRGLRPCDSEEDGWVFEASLDLIADVELTAAERDVSGRTQGLLLLTESGVCIDRVLVNGVEPRPGLGASRAHATKTDVKGRHWDEAGRIRQVNCEIVESGTR